MPQGNESARLRWAPQRRIPSLDALRGIAAFAVAVHHAALQRFTIERHAAYSPGSGVFAPVLFWMGTWGVTLFFVLSGFCIHLPQARREFEGAPFIGWREFYKRRARRLLPTHYASIAVACLAAVFVPTDLVTRPTAGTLAAHVFMAHTLVSMAYFYSINAVFWSIAVEVHFYLTYPILQRMRKRLGPWFLVALLVLGGVVYGAAYLRPEGDSRFVIQHLFLVTWWQWGLGAALADIYVRGTAHPLLRAVVFPGAAWIWGASSLLVAYLDPVAAGVHVRPWIAPALCAAALLAASIGNPRARGTRPFEWIGEFSYSLYLIHPVALAVTMRLLHRGTTSSLVEFALDVAACIVVSWVFFQLVERHFLNTQPRAIPQ